MGEHIFPIEIQSSSTRSIEIIEPISLYEPRVLLLKILQSDTNIRKHLITRMRRIDTDLEMCPDDIEIENLHKN
jgi:hypothetical protein